MAKIKVHELSKEYDVPSKDIIAFLNGKGIEDVKSPQKGLSDEEEALVREHFGGGKTAVKSEDKPAVTEAPAAPKTEETDNKPAEKKKAPAQAVDPDKKKAKPKKNTMTFVFNPNNSNAAGTQRKPGRDRRPDGKRPVGPSGMKQAPTSGGLIKPRRGVDHIGKSAHAVTEPETEDVKLTTDSENIIQEAPVKEAPKANISEEKKANDGLPQVIDRVAVPSKKKRPEGAPQRRERPERPERNDSGRGQNVNNNGPSQNLNKKTDGRKPDKKSKNNQRKNNLETLGGKQERFINLEKNGGKKKAPKKPVQEDKDEIKSIKVPDTITIRELAERMKIQASQIIKKLFMQGQIVTLNTELEYEQAENVAVEFEYLCEREEKVDVIENLLREEEEDEKKMVSRPPVVCVMGHVDHGKTSLLDAIRDTKVTDREAGGITQAIGAYVVNINGQKITFLDTPGHEAFTAMRMRGANSTDIAILVVAADDGVMPQTVEAINHAKAAGVEIIVAVNKIDKPGANIDRVKQELSEYELIPEDWGGSTVFVPVSAKTREGIDNLLEMILLTSEVLELKANPKRLARGLVIEAQLDKGRGTVATVLVQKGTLHVGDPVAAGSSYGKVRAMIDDEGRRVKSAGPSTPVEILGLSDVPNAGEIFVSMDSEREARAFAETFISENKSKLVEDTKMQMSLDDLYSKIQSGSVKELNIIVKADVQGSVEALKQSLLKLSNDEVVIKIIHGGVGAINESDVSLASASNAIIIGFNVRPDAVAKQTADTEGIDIRLYTVIYNAIEDVEAAMKGMLDPIFEEKVIGHAEVRQIFKSSDVGNIAGSYVLDGFFERGCKVRVNRGKDMIFEGDLASLKRFKDDVKEVKAGFECGLVISDFPDINVEDVIEAYKMVEVPR